MPVSIAPQAIARHWNPLDGDPWGAGVDPREVERALHEGRFEARPYSSVRDGAYDHAARIAYLVQHPSRDPIHIDVGVPSLGLVVRWPITDGNHRLAAALVRGDCAIEAEVSGSVGYAEDLFDVRIDEDTFEAA